MKSAYRMKWVFYAFVAGFALLLFGDFAFASESASSWRSTYDLVLRWINFGIIVFLLVKFGKKPLMNFLHSRKESLARDIDLLEKEKNKANQSIKEAKQQLEESIGHFAELKERIVRQGAKQKDKIIEDARIQSGLMIEASKQKVKAIIQNAKNSFRAELVDAAFDLAMEKIPDEITDEDNRKLLTQYIDRTSSILQSSSNR
ncbi:F-type H+-transporting ATPase subunit b [Desulfosarcina sp. BuS5]|uniref:F0F1 ATP synthase subunit B family protein n=1 Tax=Desulfosarcina sp. BuS5 TaxID=933262 RepID=UPI0004892422|nr:ATP synthase F0 subunit B [Desulfosarcina sp. BuS5]WDN89562.1 F-type H+-transporting ATPase subunit b [Desulfosarcina sp. BuS5]